LDITFGELRHTTSKPLPHSWLEILPTKENGAAREREIEESRQVFHE